MSFLLDSYRFGETIPYGNTIDHWRFDANSNDFVGSNNGTDTDISYASGKVSNAASFNGTTSRIDFGVNASLRIFTDGSDKAGSITGWVKFDSTAGTQYILNKRGVVATSDREYWVLYNGTDLRFVLFDQTNGGNIRVDYTWTPTTGVWYHIACVYNGNGASSGMTMYVDSVSVGTQTSTGTYVSQVGGVGELVMGELNSGGSFFAGDLDEFTFWSSALTLTQIELIKSEGDLGNQIA